MRQSYCARYWYMLDVCLSVCPSHAGIVSKRLNLSSDCLHCPMILVFWGPNFSRNSNGNTHNGGVKCKGYEKLAISDQYIAIARKRLKIDGYMLRCVSPALNPLSIHVTFTAIIPGAYPAEANMIVLRLIAVTDARSVGDSHPSCHNMLCSLISGI